MTHARERAVGFVALALLALIGALVVHAADPSDGGRGAAAMGMGRTGTAGSAPVSATIIIDRGGLATGYATPRVTISTDGRLSVLNMDSYTHTVTSEATDASGDPLFDVVVPPGATRSIPDATGLAAG